MTIPVYTILVLGLFGGTFSQNFNLQVCPSDWTQNNGRCYHFVNYPQLNYEDASLNCQRDGAILLTIETDAEHVFVRNRLKALDRERQDWYTSGERDISVAITDYRYVWTATNTLISPISQMWIRPLEHLNKDLTKDVVAYVYNFNTGLYALGVIGDRSKQRPFVCEIARDEVYRISVRDRDFDYGVSYFDRNTIKRGPKFTIEPKDTVILSRTSSMYMECIASGIDLPEYQWTRLTDNTVITQDLDTRYTITNGRFTIDNPQDLTDAGMYQCQASNTIGIIISAPVQLSFATLGEFSNVNAADVTPPMYQGAVIECPNINSRLSQGIRYQWLKITDGGSRHGEFVRPELNNYIFISGNGKLYFSEVTNNDNGIYVCVATLTSVNVKDNYVGGSQPPSRNSRGVTLNVTTSGGGTYSPDIQDSFINVVPGSPVAGMNISLECFAYGTMPLSYNWEYPYWDYRYSITDSGRILKIMNVQLDDSGKFACRVNSPKQGAAYDRKEYYLNVESRPTFQLPLQDQHLDKGTRQLTWRCEARGIPFPTYQWYKDGQLLQNSSDSDILLYKNTLVLKTLDKERDDGMYQCAATNSYGTTMSTAQLRVLSIKPSFNKYPMTPTTSGAIGGNVTILCRPEAAPFPQFTWLRNGGDLNAQVDSDARIRLNINGDLEIRQLSSSDQGNYVCKVQNELGETQGNTQLFIYQNTAIYQRPSPITVQVNATGFLYCKASFNQNNLDLVYQWAFNNRIISLNNNFHYSRGNPPDNEGGLYLRAAQYDHSGTYTCIARTQVDSANASATIRVTGPPGEPAGLDTSNADPNIEGVSARDVILRWTDPLDTHGSPINSYMIHGMTNFSKEWVILEPSVAQPYTVMQGALDTQRREYLLRNLKPGVAYQFKIRAINQFGVGVSSLPTRKTVIPGAAPIKAVDAVGGGGGSVGTLMILWTPLLPEDHNGWNISYDVEWRSKPPPGQQENNVKWNKHRVWGNGNHHSVTLPSKDFYYLPYQVRVTPNNAFGSGPMRTNNTVYSAEGMPLGIPRNVYASPFNESAIIVYWDPIPNTREVVKGRLKGYKINYWLKDTQTIHDAIQAVFYKDTDHGMIIGLKPDTWYTVIVLVFNHAGNGLKSEVAHQSTDRSAPTDYPVNVEVYPNTENSVKVRFRGLSTGTFEEPLLGYKIRYWRDTDDIRNAKNVDCEKRTEGVIHKIQPDYLYHLRVLGYSQGGDGKMSSPETLFSYMRGRVTQVQVDPSTSEVVYVFNDGTDDAVSMSVCLYTLISGLLTLLVIM